MDNIRNTIRTINQYFYNLNSERNDEAINEQFKNLIENYQSSQIDSVIVGTVHDNAFANTNDNRANQEVLAFNETLMKHRTTEQKENLFEFRHENGLMFAISNLPVNKISEYFIYANPGAANAIGSNALHNAALQGQSEAIEFLSTQKNKDEYFVRNDKGDSPIDFCVNGQDKLYERMAVIVQNFVNKNNPDHVAIIDAEMKNAVGQKPQEYLDVLSQSSVVNQDLKKVVVNTQAISPTTGIMEGLINKINSIRESAGFGAQTPNNSPKPSNKF